MSPTRVQCDRDLSIRSELKCSILNFFKFKLQIFQMSVFYTVPHQLATIFIFRQ